MHFTTYFNPEFTGHHDIIAAPSAAASAAPSAAEEQAPSAAEEHVGDVDIDGNDDEEGEEEYYSETEYIYRGPITDDECNEDEPDEELSPSVFPWLEPEDELAPAHEYEEPEDEHVHDADNDGNAADECEQDAKRRRLHD